MVPVRPQQGPVPDEVADVVAVEGRQQGGQRAGHGGGVGGEGDPAADDLLVRVEHVAEVKGEQESEGEGEE